MNKPSILLLTVLSLLVLQVGCRSGRVTMYPPAPLTPGEREEIQTRVFDGDFDNVFSSTIAVLQQEGWDIQDIKKDSGVMQALTPRRLDPLAPSEEWMRKAGEKDHPKKEKSETSDMDQWTRWEKLTAHIEPWGDHKTRNRISIVRFGTLPAINYEYSKRVSFFGPSKKVIVSGQSREEQAMVEDPLEYGLLFGKIEKAVAERKNLNAK